MSDLQEERGNRVVGGVWRVVVDKVGVPYKPRGHLCSSGQWRDTGEGERRVTQEMDHLRMNRKF